MIKKDPWDDFFSFTDVLFMNFSFFFSFGNWFLETKDEGKLFFESFFIYLFIYFTFIGSPLLDQNLSSLCILQDFILLKVFLK